MRSYVPEDDELPGFKRLKPPARRIPPGGERPGGIFGAGGQLALPAPGSGLDSQAPPEGTAGQRAGQLALPPPPPPPGSELGSELGSGHIALPPPPLPHQPGPNFHERLPSAHQPARTSPAHQPARTPTTEELEREIYERLRAKEVQKKPAAGVQKKPAARVQAKPAAAVNKAGSGGSDKAAKAEYDRAYAAKWKDDTKMGIKGFKRTDHAQRAGQLARKKCPHGAIALAASPSVEADVSCTRAPPGTVSRMRIQRLHPCS